VQDSIAGAGSGMFDLAAYLERPWWRERLVATAGQDPRPHCRNYRRLGTGCASGKADVAAQGRSGEKSRLRLFLDDLVQMWTASVPSGDIGAPRRFARCTPSGQLPNSTAGSNKAPATLPAW
jgi:hypothetical protein